MVVAATAAFEQLGIHAAAGQQINILIEPVGQRPVVRAPGYLVNDLFFRWGMKFYPLE